MGMNAAFNVDDLGRFRSGSGGSVTVIVKAGLFSKDRAMAYVEKWRLDSPLDERDCRKLVEFFTAVADEMKRSDAERGEEAKR